MADQPKPSSRPRPFWRRLLVRLPIVLVIFLVVLVLLTQALLWSNIPKRVAEREISNALGVTARIEKLSIAWNGKTRLSGLSLQLPMAEEPFAQVSSVEIDHTALPLLVFEQNVDSATARGARLHLREESAGRWNVQRLLESRAGRRDPAAQSAKQIPDLPDIILQDVAVRVTRQNGRDATIDGITARFAHAAGAAAIEKTIEARLGEHVWAAGRLALVRDLPHEIRVKVDQIPPAVEALFGPIRQPAAAAIEWRGRRTSEGIAGILDIDGARFGEFAVEGKAGLRTHTTVTPADESEIELLIEPDGLSLVQIQGTATTAPAATQVVPPRAITFKSGEIALGPDRVRLDRVRGLLNDGAVVADGWLEFATLASDLTLAWQEITQGGAHSSGSATFKTQRKLTGALSAEARVQTSLRLAAGEARSSLELLGEGESLESFVADLRTRPLRWQPAGGNPPLLVPALVGRVQADGKLIRLLDLRPADPSVGTIIATAAFDRAQPLWWVAIDGRALQLGQLGLSAAEAGTTQHELATRPTDLNINVAGTFSRVDVKQFYLMQGQGAFWAAGFYDATLPQPLRLDTWASYAVPRGHRAVDQLKGLSAHGVVAGTLNPRNLKANGTIQANELVLRGRRFGDIEVDVDAQLTAESGTLQSRELELLGGQWSLRGAWQAGAFPPQLVVSLHDLPAGRLAELFKVEGVEGQIESGEATFIIPNTRIDDIHMRARVLGEGLKYKTLAADELQITATVDDGKFIAKPVLVREDGRIESEVDFRLRDPTPITATAKLIGWPVPPISQDGQLAGVESALSGDVQLHISPATGEVQGETSLTGTITRLADGGGREAVGDLRVEARMINDELDVSELTINALNGQVAAGGKIRFGDLQASQIDLKFDRLAPATLAWLSPQFAEAAGHYSGEFHLYPSPASINRPLGPVQARLSIVSDSGSWRGIELRSIDSVAFAQYRAPGDFRIVTQSAQVDVAGGTIKPFVRFSNAPGQGRTLLLSGEFEKIDIEPVIRAFKDEGEPVIGRAAGEIRIYGATRTIDALSAEARVRLSESDLVNFGPVAFLYDLMRVGTSGSEPRGEGKLTLRMERGELSLLSADYFNRGVYISGFGTIKDVAKLPNAPIDLTLVGSAQPLRDIKLPFFADADKIMQVLQSTLTTIRAEGTLKDPKPRQAALDELGQTFEKIVVGNRRPAEE